MNNDFSKLFNNRTTKTVFHTTIELSNGEFLLTQTMLHTVGCFGENIGHVDIWTGYTI